MILSGDFNFVDAHGPFWSIFGVEILIFIFCSFIFVVFISDLSNRIPFASQREFSFSTSQIEDFGHFLNFGKFQAFQMKSASHPSFRHAEGVSSVHHDPFRAT